MTLPNQVYDALRNAGLIDDDGIIPTLSSTALQVLDKRCLGRDIEGEVIEVPDDLFHRVAHNISQAELKYGATEAHREEVEADFYGFMKRLEFLPNSPTLANAGRDLQQLSGCFVLPVPDSIAGIFESVKDTALIHKSGGGTGFSFSKLRPEGEAVRSTGGIASGPVSFMNAFDVATDVVKQGGMRRGANMGILEVTHPDIMKFVTAKMDPKSFNNFNLSVGVTEAWMQAALQQEDYCLLDPRTHEPLGTLNAGEVLDTIIQCAWASGDPGLVFLDRINQGNPNPQLGTIESTNPCGEQPLLPYESCNLGSINLARMTRPVEPGQMSIDYWRLKETVHLAVRFLDNVIDMNEYPIPAISEMSHLTRRIGLGVMGFADMLIQLGIKYDSEDGLSVAKDIMKFIYEESEKASTFLAGDRGVFPAWKDSIYPALGKVLRNSAPTTIAPTGTLSIIAGVSSGIEPLIALRFERRQADLVIPEEHPYLAAISRQVNVNGAYDLFPTAHEIDPEWHLRMQGVFQNHVHNAVSKTINFPNDASVDGVRRAYHMAYELGCKGITIFRDGSKGGDQVFTTLELVDTV